MPDIDIARFATPMEKTLILDPSQPLQSARELIAHRFTVDGIRTIHHWRGQYFLWEGSAYRPADDDEMASAIWSFCDKARRAVGKKNSLVPFAPNRSKTGEILAALRAASNLSASVEPPTWLASATNAPPSDFILVRNGMLHIPTKELYPPTPDFFAVNALPVEYDADAEDPKNWLGFLHQLWTDDPESINTLQEIFGLMLVNVTAYQKIFMLVGPKRSGKGTISRILTAMVGKDNTASPTLGSLSTNFGISPLIGKNLATINDARLGGKADQASIAERLLSISGEDSHTIDRKYLEAWTGRLITRFLILTNELPRISDASGALASRFIILQLTQSFFGREDHSLANRLIGELPGIFLWTLEGLERLQDRGAFIQPSSAQEAVEELEALGSPILSFIKDRCIVAPGVSCDAEMLFAAWHVWCDQDNRRDAGRVQTFGRDLRAAVPGLEAKKARLGQKRYTRYEGIELQ